MFEEHTQEDKESRDFKRGRHRSHIMGGEMRKLWKVKSAKLALPQGCPERISVPAGNVPDPSIGSSSDINPPVAVIGVHEI